MTPVRLSVGKARKLIADALVGAGATPANTSYFTEAILDTELSGLEGHGFYWLQYYCQHVKSGKVKGHAKPKVRTLTPVAFRVDPEHGFAHPAVAAGFKKLVPAARKYGIAAMAITNSYNAATLGFHTGTLAKQGLLAFGFTNATPTMAPIGGTKPVLGTNPMSFAVPGNAGQIAFLIDQSSSTVAWTAIKRAAEQQLAIPLGWALDSDGAPTTDPHRGLAGSMVPSGGAKGFGQGLMVEVLCSVLTGSALGIDMGSFTDDQKPINCGQFFIAIEPKIFAGGMFQKSLTRLINAITSQPGARLPNARRMANQKRLRKEGLTIDAELFRILTDYARMRSPVSPSKR